jgi:hypothetical protein
VITTIPADKGTHNVACNGKPLYLTSRNNNRLLVLSGADVTVKAEMETGDEPHGVACQK